MYYYGKHECSRQQHLQVRERVAKRVIRRAEGFFEAHQVDYECCRADEEDFHCCVVDRDEVHEEVKVADAEN